MSTTADMAWTNLPAKGDYVSLMFHLVAHLARDHQRSRNLLVGREVSEPLTAVESSLPLRLTTPGGRAMRPNLVPTASALAASYGPLDEPARSCYASHAKSEIRNPKFEWPKRELSSALRIPQHTATLRFGHLNFAYRACFGFRISVFSDAVVAKSRPVFQGAGIREATVPTRSSSDAYS